MKRLLVTGASGFLGGHLCDRAISLRSPQWQVTGTYWRGAVVSIPGMDWVALDLTNLSMLKDRLAELNPDAIVHLAALSQPNACQTQPELSYQINVLASWAIAEFCAQRQIPLVFTSSEQVFDGLNPPYCETDRPSPINLYGEHKLAAEQGIAERYGLAAIARMPLMYGFRPGSVSFVQPFLERLRTGVVLEVFVDEVRMPVYGDDAADGLLMLLDREFSGLIHLGGPEALSRYDMAQQLVAVFNIPNAQVQPCSQADVVMAAARPLNLMMDHAIASGLGYAPRSFRQGLETHSAKPSGSNRH